MINQPDLTPVPGSNEYMLLDDYTYQYGDQKIIVPQFFIFDGASIPWFGWLSTYTPFHPDVMAPAVIHDWLYLNHQVNRKLADQIFYDLLIANGAGPKRSKLMFTAVRFASEKYWNPNRLEKIRKLELLYVLARPNPRFDEYHFPCEVINVTNPAADAPTD